MSPLKCNLQTKEAGFECIRHPDTKQPFLWEQKIVSTGMQLGQKLGPSPVSVSTVYNHSWLDPFPVFWIVLRTIFVNFEESIENVDLLKFIYLFYFLFYFL